jgi:Kef-type K+ transport system membrane component KefB
VGSAVLTRHRAARTVAAAALLSVAAVALVGRGVAIAGTGPQRPVAPAPLGATSEGEILGVATGLFILLLAAKLGEEAMRRLGQPGVIGELLGGFVVGPYALGIVVPGETALVFAELGVIVLLFTVGLEVRTDDLFAVGRPAVLTAVIAMALPLIAGAGLATIIGKPPMASVFVGLALAATSIGITTRVLRDLGVLERRFARVVIGAALVDDILALVLIGLASGAAEGDVSIDTVIVAVTGIGLVVLGFAAARRARGLPAHVFTWPLFADTPLVPAFLIMLAIALLAAAIGLAAIIGAFIAGLILAETEAAGELERDFRPLASIFTPFFFAVTGAQIDLAMLLDPSVAALALALAVLGVLTKALGGIIGARSIGRWDAVIVGFGMVPRGEVGIVVANLALVAGLIDLSVFAAVMAAVVLTTVVAPYLVTWAVRRATVPASAAV